MFGLQLPNAAQDQHVRVVVHPPAVPVLEGHKRGGRLAGQEFGRKMAPDRLPRVVGEMNAN